MRQCRFYPYCYYLHTCECGTKEERCDMVITNSEKAAKWEAVDRGECYGYSEKQRLWLVGTRETLSDKKLKVTQVFEPGQE